MSVDPFTIIMLLTGFDSSLATAIVNLRNSYIVKQASRIAAAVSADQDTLNNLLDAYNRKDTDYANAVMKSSPFSSGFSNLKTAINNNRSNISKAKEDLATVNKRAAAANKGIAQQQALNTSSGSVIVDLINAGASSKAWAQTDSSYQPVTEAGTKAYD